MAGPRGPPLAPLRLTHKCLDAYGQGTTNNTAAAIWDCNGQANQQRSVSADGIITGVQSGLCLDANAAGTANGTKLLLWGCNGDANQSGACATDGRCPRGSIR